MRRLEFIAMPTSFTLRWAGLLSAALLIAGSTSAQKLVDVNYPGATVSQIFAINNHGASVGNGLGHAFILSNGTFTNIDVPGGVQTQPFGINDNGDVVGAYFDPGLTHQHGFLLKAGTYTTIDYPGATGTQARGINNAGQIVGQYSTPGHIHGFRLIAGVLSTLDCPCGGSVATELFAVNNTGTIVGAFVDAGFASHGLEYNAGTFTTRDFPGSSTTVIDAVNDAGTLSGTFLDPADHLNKGFERINGQYSALGLAPLPSDGVWYVVVNNSGQIAGSTYDPTIANSFNGPAFFVSSGPFAYVPNSTPATLSVFDLSFNLLAKTIQVGAGAYDVAVNPNGSFAYVGNYQAASVSVIDTASNTVVATVPVGAGPSGLAITPDGSRVYVANHISNTVSVIAAAANTVITTLPVGVGPLGLAGSPDGKYIYVANQSSSGLSLINTVTNTVSTIPVGAGTAWVAVRPDGKFAYATTGQLAVIDTSTNTIVRSIAAGAGWYITISPDSMTAYLSQFANPTVTALDLVSETLISTTPVGQTPQGSAITPDGAFLWQANSSSPFISVISTADNSVAGNVPVTGGNSFVAMGPAAPLSQTITQALSPTAPNQFNFGSHSFTVQYPAGTAFSGVNMTVVAAQAAEVTFKQRVAATAFANATCIVYAGGGGNCVDYKVTCSNSGGNAITCPSTSTPSISVKTSFDTLQQIINPGFLTTPIGTNTWSNIFDSFYLQRIDPTMKGRTRGFSEFVAVDLGVGNAQGAGTFSFMAPLQQNETRIFPAGTAIPVGFQLASLTHFGSPISDAVAGITIVKVSDANGSPVSQAVLQQPNAFAFNGSGYTYSLNTAGYAAGVYNLTIYGNAFAAQQIQFTIPASTSGAHLLTTVKSLTLNSTSHQYVAVLNVANSGTGAANGVIVTIARLNSASTLTALPVSLGDINPGASATVTLSFPTSAGASRSAGTLTIVESYAGGSGGGGSRVTLP